MLHVLRVPIFGHGFQGACSHHALRCWRPMSEDPDMGHNAASLMFPVFGFGFHHALFPTRALCCDKPMSEDPDMGHNAGLSEAPDMEHGRA